MPELVKSGVNRDSLLKDRYGEELPKDIEAARAWWKANENRFAAKETAAPKSKGGGARDSRTPITPKSEVASKQGTDSQPSSETTSREIRWSIPVAIVTAFVAIVAWFFRKRQ